MKHIRKISGIMAFALVMFFANIIAASACEIEFEVVKGEKEAYTKGDVFVVKIVVLLTHRNCPEPIEKTSFKTSGLKVMKATKWTQTSSTTFERKLKIEVTDDSKKEIKLSAERVCDKEGGFGMLTLKTK